MQAHLLPVLGLSEEDPAGSEAMAFHFLKHEKTATCEHFFFFSASIFRSKNVELAMAPEPALMAGWQRRYNSQTMHCGANHPINDRSMTHARHPHEKRGLFHRFSNVDMVSL